MATHSPDLSQILGALMSPDNAIRTQAEQVYNFHLTGANLLPTVQSLLTIFSTSSVPIPVRSFSGVLLRKVITTHSSSFGPHVVTQMRVGMLQMWANETNYGEDNSPLFLLNLFFDVLKDFSL